MTADEMAEAIDEAVGNGDFEFKEEWEEDFFISIQTQLAGKRKLSPKQVEKLKAIYAKLD